MYTQNQFSFWYFQDNQIHYLQNVKWENNIYDTKENLFQLDLVVCFSDYFTELDVENFTQVERFVVGYVEYGRLNNPSSNRVFLDCAAECQDYSFDLFEKLDFFDGFAKVRFNFTGKLLFENFGKMLSEI